MEQAEILAELTRRVAELETLVRLLAIVVAVLAAVLVTAAALAAMWLRSRHAEVMQGLGRVAEGQEELRDEVRMADVSRARHEGVLVH